MFSNNKAPSSANKYGLDKLHALTISLMYILNKSGPSKLPCGTPNFMLKNMLFIPKNFVACFLPYLLNNFQSTEFTMPSTP